MKTKVKLNDIIEAFEKTHSEFNYSLNMETGEVIQSVPDSDFQDKPAIEGELIGYPTWEKEMIISEKEIRVADKQINIEGLDTHDGFEIMEDFCLSLGDEKTSSALLGALKTKDAFSKFKEEISALGLEKKWIKFKRNAIKKIAVQWCNINGIDYQE